MKAIIQHQYGGPEKLSFGEIERPQPKKNEVLVRVHYSSINPLDWHYMRGTPKLMRIGTGLFKPHANVIGSDLSGVVEEIGPGVKNFKVGDRVFGGHRVGAYGEYCIASPEKLVVMPKKLSFKDAAAIPIAGITALQALRDHGTIKSGTELLINGSSGGVGTFAVQIARHFGATITTVCSTEKIEQAIRLGADHTVDYKKEEILNCGKQFDFIMDNVGNKSPKEWKTLLKPNGFTGVIGLTSYGLLIRHMLGGKQVKMINTSKTPEDLLYLANLVLSGEMQVEHDREVDLQDLAEAMAYVEDGHAFGKVTVKVGTHTEEEKA